MIQKRSALDENSKIQILSNELMRRLANTDSRQERRVVAEIVDKFCVKLLTSGYSPKQVRRITLIGSRGWEKKLEIARREGKSIFRTSKESLPSRIKKKLTGKTSWYRKKANKKKTDSTKEDDTKKLQGQKGNRSLLNREGVKDTASSQDKEAKELKTAAVLFVENSKGGELARNIREVLGRIQNILGFKIKVVERAGTPLRMMFPLSKIGEGKECGRKDCITCTQDSRGEELPPCTKRSVLYENIRLVYNPGAGGEEGKKLTPPMNIPSIYVGESARSLYERGKEHWRAFRNKNDDSHILKHHVLHHGGKREPAFHQVPENYPDPPNIRSSQNCPVGRGENSKLTRRI